jgi:hypothetical protein
VITNMMNKTLPVLMAALAVAALVAAGCGSSSGGGATSATGGGATSSAATSAHAKAVRFSECMRTHGVADFPDPTADNDYDYGVSVSEVVWTRAVTACRAWQPPGTLSSRRSRTQQSGALKFAACIRAHGVRDFPDPVNGEPVVDTNRIPSSNRPGGMTILNAAMAKCAALGPRR